MVQQRIIKLKIDIEIPFDDIYERGTETALIDALTCAIPKLTTTINLLTAEQSVAPDKNRLPKFVQV